MNGVFHLVRRKTRSQPGGQRFDRYRPAAQFPQDRRGRLIHQEDGGARHQVDVFLVRAPEGMELLQGDFTNGGLGH